MSAQRPRPPRGPGAETIRAAEVRTRFSSCRPPSYSIHNAHCWMPPTDAAEHQSGRRHARRGSGTPGPPRAIRGEDHHGRHRGVVDSTDELVEIAQRKTPSTGTDTANPRKTRYVSIQAATTKPRRSSRRSAHTRHAPRAASETSGQPIFRAPWASARTARSCSGNPAGLPLASAVGAGPPGAGAADTRARTRSSVWYTSEK